MKKILLKAEQRTEIGKGGARSLRRQGMLPAVIYAGGKSTPIKFHRKEIVKLITSGVGEHAILNIEFSKDGGKPAEHPALIKEYQKDPVSTELLHVDFMEISLKEKIKISIPIVITKEPVSIKTGGIMEHHLREIEIECLPTQIPEAIEIDAGSVEIGHSLHVSDIKPIEGIRIVTNPQMVIMNVTAPRVEEAPAVAAEAVAAEPEVLKAKAKEEGSKEEPKKEKGK
ncbi:MAG: 50S ribosomal protein L25 [Nitrospirae bacterium]|nr:50S ribosomal protein L25 [Nitrospirota bacterium]